MKEGPWELLVGSGRNVALLSPPIESFLVGKLASWRASRLSGSWVGERGSGKEGKEKEGEERRKGTYRVNICITSLTSQLHSCLCPPSLTPSLPFSLSLPLSLPLPLPPSPPSPSLPLPLCPAPTTRQCYPVSSLMRALHNWCRLPGGPLALADRWVM